MTFMARLFKGKAVTKAIRSFFFFFNYNNSLEAQNYMAILGLSVKHLSATKTL